MRRGDPAAKHHELGDVLRRVGRVAHESRGGPSQGLARRLMQGFEKRRARADNGLGDGICLEFELLGLHGRAPLD